MAGRLVITCKVCCLEKCICGQYTAERQPKLCRHLTNTYACTVPCHYCGHMCAAHDGRGCLATCRDGHECHCLAFEERP